MTGRIPNYFRLATDDEIIKVRNTAEKILCNFGFRYENQTILVMAEKKGLKVDFPKQHVTFTPQLFAWLEEAAIRNAGSSKTDENILRRPLSKGYGIGRNIVKHYDWRSGISRQAVMQDNIDIMKAGQMLNEVTAVAPLFTANDVPFMIEPIVGTAHALKISDKPFTAIEMMMGEQLPYLEELETIKMGKQVRYTSAFASMTRFTLDERAAFCLENTWRRNGLTYWGTNSCPLAGMNSPVTAAGSAALAMAEMIGGWLAGWVLNEDVNLGVIPVSGTVDMRTTRIMFSTPQAVLIDALLFQIFDRLYGINTVPECSSTYIDGKIPGMQLLHDKIYKTLSMFSLTGCHVANHFGMMESGSSICPAQMILDFEINREMEIMTRGLEINEDTLALDTIIEVGIQGDFLTSDHTLDYYKQTLWHSTLFDCTAFCDSQEELKKEKEALEKAQTRYDEVLASYKPISISDDKLKAIDDVVSRAKKDILGK